mgnify:CR=1 FL=1
MSDRISTSGGDAKWLPVLKLTVLTPVSAVLLMVAMYLPSPLAFSSFPSVLLVTTLFRLGISIATTRLILLQGDAGSIIQTFGNFVVFVLQLNTLFFW